jgi:hypothetical protein
LRRRLMSVPLPTPAGPAMTRGGGPKLEIIEFQYLQTQLRESEGSRYEKTRANTFRSKTLFLM